MDLGSNTLRYPIQNFRIYRVTRGLTKIDCFSGQETVPSFGRNGNVLRLPWS